jgi:hypothetical protein
MTTILNLIYCWLQGFWASFMDVYLGFYSVFLDIATAALTALGSVGLSFPEIPSEYAWVFGALGLSQAFGIFATAWLVRFTLQSIPFVRWGS